MCKTLKLCVLTAALAAVLAGLAAAADVTAVNELVDHSLQWNGKTVAIEGEAIGEMLPRGNYAWVNINDGTNAIGVWMPLADAKKISVYGDYHHTGDTLRVTGTFSRDCAEHGGDVDIHSDSVQIVKTGGAVGHPVSGGKKAAAAGLSAAALLAAFFCFGPRAKRR